MGRKRIGLLIDRVCPYCNKKMLNNHKFCSRNHYWLWMKGKSSEEILGEEKACIKRDKEKLIRKNKNYVEIYGEEQAIIVRKNQSLSQRGLKKDHSKLTTQRKGKTLEEIYSKEKSVLIRHKQSNSRKGKSPWNKDLTKEIDERVLRASYKVIPMHNRFGYYTSNKADNIFYQSLGELGCLKFLSNLDLIKSIGRCHFWLFYIDEYGKKRRYFPDFEVELLENEKMIIEVKPMGCYSITVNNKMLALMDYCEERNYKLVMFPSVFDKCYNNAEHLIKAGLQEKRKGFEVMIPTGN